MRILRGLPWFTLAVLTTLVVAAVFGGLIAPHDIYSQDLLNRLEPPAWLSGGSREHLLGTDALGRDILSR
ncbi:MAG TPA: ABC transporter permease, partial [Polyangiaceae bacterium]|nr:ABC transporter permease [Polyangiaceae bacterium]